MDVLTIKKLPAMILFDYGQTLCTESGFDRLAGTRAVLEQAENPRGVPAEEIVRFSQEMDAEIGRCPTEPEKDLLEKYNPSFQRYLYEYFGIRLKRTPVETEQIFWDAAAPAGPTEGILDLLRLLRGLSIRTGVVSNLAYTGETLERRIRACIPDHPFEFILASSDYVYRKPHPRFYELALRRAELSAADVWFCGDNAVCDVDGPARAGMKAVWYVGAMRNPHCMHLTPKEDCLKIDSWNALRKILEDPAGFVS